MEEEMNWREFIEQYSERPEEHFDDPADYQEKYGDPFIAKQIRARRKKIELGIIEEPQEGGE